MSIDLTKLTPAPWDKELDADYGGYTIWGPNVKPIACKIGELHADWIILARQAFDVMMRRWWTATYRGGVDPGWFVVNVLDEPLYPPGDGICADPFTALVEADEWYKLNVEAAHAGEKAQA